MIGIHRIKRDMSSLSHYGAAYWNARPRSDADLFTWDCEIDPHEHSKFCDTKVSLIISFPANFPMSPPVIRVINSGMNHPCMSSDGTLDLFSNGEEWSPAYSIGAIIVSVAAMLNDYDENLIRQIERTDLIRRELYAAHFVRSNPIDLINRNLANLFQY